MSPEQCEVVRNALCGWEIAHALCGSEQERHRLVHSYPGRYANGVRSQGTVKGIEVLTPEQKTARLAVRWSEVFDHLGALPTEQADRVRAVCAEDRRLWARCYSHAQVGHVIDEDAARAHQEHFEREMAPALVSALTPARELDLLDMLAGVS